MTPQRDFHQRRIEKIGSIRNGAARARALTLEFLSRYRLSNLSIVTVKNPGIFIGPCGSNIRGLQERTGTTIYGTGPWGSKKFMVFYNTETELVVVTQAARRCEEKLRVRRLTMKEEVDEDDWREEPCPECGSFGHTIPTTDAWGFTSLNHPGARWGTPSDLATASMVTPTRIQSFARYTP